MSDSNLQGSGGAGGCMTTTEGGSLTTGTVIYPYPGGAGGSSNYYHPLPQYNYYVIGNALVRVNYSGETWYFNVDHNYK